MTDEQNTDNELFTYLAAGLVAFSEQDWKYPYPSALNRGIAGVTQKLLAKGGNYPIAISQFIRMLEEPLNDWWPGNATPEGIDPNLALLEPELRLSPHVEEFLYDLDELLPQSQALSQVKSILDHLPMREMIQRIQTDHSLQDAYVTTRRFLIEHPWFNAEDGADFPPYVYLMMKNRPDNFYEKPDPNMLHDARYWECPRCRGILLWVNGNPRCAKDNLCSILTSGFHEAKPIPKNASPKVLKLALRKRVQLPGLPELEFANRLKHIDGINISLWPEQDAYDLRVEFANGEVLKFDVKDFASEVHLAKKLRQEKSSQESDILFVIPDYREHIKRGYMADLRRQLSGSKTKVIMMSDATLLIQQKAQQS